MMDLLTAGIDLMKTPRATPLEVAALGGIVQCNNLLNRFLFSCVGHTIHVQSWVSVDILVYVRRRDPRGGKDIQRSPARVFPGCSLETDVKLTRFCFFALHAARSLVPQASWAPETQIIVERNWKYKKQQIKAAGEKQTHDDDSEQI